MFRENLKKKIKIQKIAQNQYNPKIHEIQRFVDKQYFKKCLDIGCVCD